MTESCPPDRRDHPRVVGAVTTGPDHALHFILTLLTFWACGGWAWIWLLVALFSKRRVHAVDEYGRLVQPQRAPGAAGGAAFFLIFLMSGVLAFVSNWGTMIDILVALAIGLGALLLYFCIKNFVDVYRHNKRVDKLQKQRKLEGLIAEARGTSQRTE